MHPYPSTLSNQYFITLAAHNFPSQLMKHLFRILILLGIAINIAHAQSTVQGTVYGADDKQPLPFVTVAVYATTNGTITDVAGKFSLQSVKTTDTIIFSFVGYETLRLPAQLGGNMQVYLTTNRKIF